MLWLVLALVAALLVAGLGLWRARKAGKAWPAALQEAAESFIGTLANRGMPKEAQELARTFGKHVDAAGPLVKRLNQKLLEETKLKVAADSLSGKQTRDLIREAYAREHESK